MASTKDDRFDWVTARSRCSLTGAFMMLCQVAESNVERANELPGQKWIFEASQLDQRFVVTATHSSMPGRGPTASIGFHLRNNEIVVVAQMESTLPPELMFSAKPSLNQDGDCLLEVNGEPLQLWQVCRKALEPLFFEL